MLLITMSILCSFVNVVDKSFPIMSLILTVTIFILLIMNNGEDPEDRKTLDTLVYVLNGFVAVMLLIVVIVKFFVTCPKVDKAIVQRVASLNSAASANTPAASANTPAAATPPVSVNVSGFGRYW